MKKTMILILFALVSLVAFSQKNIVDIAVESGNFNTLVAAIETAGLTDVLKGSGPFTVFAPTDEAFEKLPAGTIKDLLDNVSKLRSVLLYHVVSGEYSSESLVLYPTIQTLHGQSLAIDTRGGLKIDGAAVTVKDIKASNGVVHVIDTVMIPREEANLVQVARDFGILETLVLALEKSSLVDTLKNGGPYTLFAPSDIAFARVPAETREALFNEPQWLKAVLLYHVVQGEYMMADLINENGLRSLYGELLNVKINEAGLGIDNTIITIGDIDTGNGVIHVIDHVMMPREWRSGLPSIVEAAEQAGQFTTLLTALKTAGLGEALSDGGLLTVFAPTDEAFAKLGQETIDGLLKDTEKLKSILTYHVIGGEYLFSELKIAQSLFTLNGKPVKINLDGTLTINNVNIISRDILTRNGVIHVIDAVLIPR